MSVKATQSVHSLVIQLMYTALKQALVELRSPALKLSMNCVLIGYLPYHKSYFLECVTHYSAHFWHALAGHNNNISFEKKLKLCTLSSIGLCLLLKSVKN